MNEIQNELVYTKDMKNLKIVKSIGSRIVSLFFLVTTPAFAQDQVWQNQDQTSQNVVYLNVASCSTEMDGVTVQVDFFQEMLLDTHIKPTGRGYFVQTIGVQAASAKYMGKLKLNSDSEDLIKVEMFAVLDPTILFSKFQLPKSLSSTSVEIVDIGRGKTWGVFSCNN